MQVPHCTWHEADETEDVAKRPSCTQLAGVLESQNLAGLQSIVYLKVRP